MIRYKVDSSSDELNLLAKLKFQKGLKLNKNDKKIFEILSITPILFSIQ